MLFETSQNILAKRILNEFRKAIQIIMVILVIATLLINFFIALS